MVSHTRLKNFQRMRSRKERQLLILLFVNCCILWKFVGKSQKWNIFFKNTLSIYITLFPENLFIVKITMQNYFLNSASNLLNLIVTFYYCNISILILNLCVIIKTLKTNGTLEFFNFNTFFKFFIWILKNTCTSTNQVKSVWHLSIELLKWKSIKITCLKALPLECQQKLCKQQSYFQRFFNHNLFIVFSISMNFFSRGLICSILFALFMQNDETKHNTSIII